MNSDLILRSGKYAGKTVGWLEQNQPSYLNWVKENQPNMLKEIKKIEPKKLETSTSSKLQPNLNFDKEGPDFISIPYLKKQI